MMQTTVGRPSATGPLKTLVRLVLALALVAVAMVSLTEPAGSTTMYQFESRIARRTGMYWCPARGFGYCALPFNAADVGSVHIACWQDDVGTPNRYFWVFLPNGAEGFVYAPDVWPQRPNAPWCGDVNWMRASEFAWTHLGEVKTSSTPTGYWSGFCWTFAHVAWSPVAPAKPTALDALRMYNNAGAADTNLSHVPPRGALVFWDERVGTSAGHVGVSMGNWSFIGTRGYDGQQLGNEVRDIRNVSGYVGWVMPTLTSEAYKSSW